MVKKKDLVIVALATFCLTASLFLIISSRSETPQGTYDPMYDVNDDGAIDVLDYIKLSNHFLTYGTPINKTALLELQSQIDSLNATVASLLSRVGNLEANYLSTIPSNSSYGTSSTQTSEAYSWIDMQNMSVTMEVNRTSRLFMMFSVTDAYCTGGPDETSTIRIQAVANSVQAMPGNVSLIPAVQVTGFNFLPAHAHPIRFGAYSYDFYVSPVAAGSYTVKIQWQVSVTTAQCTGTVGPRSLLIMAIPIA